jgi:helicase
MAAVIHPTADLARLVELLPVQLELGIPADLAPLALAGAELTREHYLTLVSAGLKTPELITAADDETVMKCTGGSRQRLRTLRDAVQRTTEAAAIPSLDEALLPPTD